MINRDTETESQDLPEKRPNHILLAFIGALPVSVLYHAGVQPRISHLSVLISLLGITPIFILGITIYQYGSEATMRALAETCEIETETGYQTNQNEKRMNQLKHSAIHQPQQEHGGCKNA